MYGRLAISILILACALAVGACASPAQGEVERGKAFLNENKPAEAYAAFDAAVALDPKNAQALTGRGCARPMTDAVAAIADLDRAIDFDPKSFDAYRCRAEAHRTAGQLDAALADATKSVELEPSDAPAHVTLGNVLDDMNRTAEAIPEYDKAIELDPKLANAYNQRSIARW